jgi:hypothetical protein
MKLTRENAILPFATAGDLSDRLGEAVSMSILNGVPTVEPLPDPGTKPFGVLIHADESSATVVPMSGGVGGTVKVKLQTAAYVGNDLYIDQTGGIKGFADAVEEAPSGNFLCAQALESGVQGELVEAILFRPVLAP